MQRIHGAEVVRFQEEGGSGNDCRREIDDNDIRHVFG
jgi:hypothetical protein